MNTPNRQSPDWHPEELSFLNKNKVIKTVATTHDLTLIKKRWAYNTLREVFLTENGYVLKRYTHFPGRKDYRKIWQREHDALKRLDGLNTPDSVGYLYVKHSARITGTLHLRTFLPGSAVDWSSEQNVQNLAALIASIHKRHVAILDPQYENFICTHSCPNAIGFIDFGRARVFSSMNFLMLFHIGKDLAKLNINGRLNSRQIETFSQNYQNLMQFSSLQNSVISFSRNYWLRRRARKYGTADN
ncbi:hypothetical protein HLV39_14465 [Marinobacter adhaerens]|uniref:Toluene tolerance protein n=1 Tax=Marinobacter adhaerens TaxID=1033846 RepID=A0A851HUG6_9GAMM|nr:hypothetical protein [Marinobacter adhaerens]NWN92697.1 hypothetical protein [Marinobacter adhaerens]